MCTRTCGSGRRDRKESCKVEIVNLFSAASQEGSGTQMYPLFCETVIMFVTYILRKPCMGPARQVTRMCPLHCDMPLMYDGHTMVMCVCVFIETGYGIQKCVNFSTEHGIRKIIK
jgi:hypothetical protein